MYLVDRKEPLPINTSSLTGRKPFRSGRYIDLFDWKGFLPINEDVPSLTGRKLFRSTSQTK
ncbi:hypothetical protein PGT21_023102 [Puccinia graminis f. sp. tritici]|uniref:Uncharacterized protein n=1 Tax=Puccinia graminis f. sp. tritici TaxID=56615 RepID=A0A5B0LSH9_PUCGR|nr:hypothetical protein PGT21_023102 [Puccinia graminis f. sp. tritici]KAA1137324.1 hypothetical protein PGTUg99_008944 [Puccinia graminis f. sp. tritici]